MPHYRTIPTFPSAPAGVSHAPPKYIRGVFAQPTYNMPGLKILGFNTLISIPMNHPPDENAKRAKELGFYHVRPPVGVKDLDEDNPLWIAWENPDEPDRVGTPQSLIDDNYAKAHAIGIPTFTNFDGSRLLGVQAPVFGPGASYASILAKTDWASSDLHPAAGWGATKALANAAISMWTPGYATDTLRELKGDADYSRILMYIETTRETQQFPGPTVEEMQIIQKQADRRKLLGSIAFTFDFTRDWGTPPGKPNGFNGMDAEHREAYADWLSQHP